MKCFICQPMKGRSEAEIRAQRKRGEEFAKRHNCEPVFESDEKPANRFAALRGLGDALRIISECEGVLFMDGWETARGCRIIHDACTAYGITQTYED